jgi:hypothetical protein
LTEEQRKLRTELLTRRTRCFVRVFSTGPRKYFQGAIPDVDWNEDLIPKELYPEEDLIAAREERNFAQEEEKMREDLRQAKEGMEERTKGDREKQRRENAARANAVQELMAKRLLQKKRKEAAKEQKRKREEEEESKEDEQEAEEEEEEEEERTRKEGEGKKKRKAEAKRQKRKREEEEDEQEEEEDMKRKENEEEEERARKEGEEKEARKRKEEEEQEEKTRKEIEDKQRKRKEEEERKKEQDGRRKTAIVAPSQAPPTKKRSRREIKSKETIGDSDEAGQTNGPSTVRAAKKQKKQKTIPGPVDSDEPDPCERCHRLEFNCISNGPRRACHTCRLAKKTCSYAEKGQSGGERPTKPQAHQKSTAAPVQPPPPPPVLNPPAAPLSHQMAQAKRKRGVNDAGEAGPSKIRKVRILVPPKETISVKEEEADPVLPTIRVLRAGGKPESKKVTPSAEGEKLGKFVFLIFLR